MINGRIQGKRNIPLSVVLLRIEQSDHFVGPSLVTYRLANQMPEPKLLPQLLG